MANKKEKILVAKDCFNDKYLGTHYIKGTKFYKNADIKDVKNTIAIEGKEHEYQVCEKRYAELKKSKFVTEEEDKEKLDEGEWKNNKKVCFGI